jgi:hypothetical protein
MNHSSRLSLALFVVLLLVGGCGQPRQTQREFAVALPPLAALDSGVPAARSASAVQVRSGEQTFRTGGNIDHSGGKPRLQPGPAELAWCLYEFDSTAAQVATQLTFTLSAVDAGSQAWIALSDYTNDTWEIFGPYTASGSVILSAPAGRYSNGAHTYFGLLAWSGSEFTIESVSLELNDPPADWMHLTGDSANNTVADCAIDPAGRLWVAGTTADLSGDGVAVVLRYSADGTLELQKTWSSAAHGGNTYSIACAADGSVYLTGYIEEASLGNPSVLLLKFDATGALLWSRTAAIAGEAGQGMGLTVATDGSVYLCGFQEDTGDGHQYVARVSPDGALVWARRWANGGFDIPRGLVLSDGALYVATTLPDPDTLLATGMLLKFGLDGSSIWAKQWDCDTVVDGEDGYLNSPGLEVDRDGNLLWAGSNLADLFTGPPYTLHVSVLRIAPDGSLVQQFGYQRESEDNYYSVFDILCDTRARSMCP